MSDLNSHLPQTAELLLLKTEEVYKRIPELQEEYMQAFAKLHAAAVAHDQAEMKTWFDECIRINKELIDAGIFVRRYLVKKAYYRSQHL
jgi:hypothetical protein